jgi:hypothetical protein
MPWNGSGAFTRLRSWVNDAAAGVKIRADFHDQEDNSFAAGISNCIARDGQSLITAPIPFNNQRITGLGDPINPQDALNKQWAQSNLVSGAYVADTPPAAAQAGNLWWDSDSGNLFLKYSDGTSTQWVQVNIAPPVVPTPSFYLRTLIPASTNSFQFGVDTVWTEVEVQGGGGGGGIANATGAGVGAAGGGGGAGGYTKKAFAVTAAIRAATKTITVGVGGGSGGNGGATSYGDTVNALSGGAGQTGSTGVSGGQTHSANGGVGGAASGGDVNIQGATGGWSFICGATILGGGLAQWRQGPGASSQFGAGGFSNFSSGSTATAATGGVGVGYGAGGAGGGSGPNAGGGGAGGAGAPGVVVITEYR